MDCKEMDLGFLILCPDKDARALHNTIRSINHYTKRDMICVVGSNASPHDIKNLKEYCPSIYKGKDTITSLINTGMKRIKNDWAFILFAGTKIGPYSERRLCRFISSDKDILFPVVEGKYNFVEGSCNGILINRITFKEVGDLPAAPMHKQGLNDLEVSKMFWASDAEQKGCQFKGIVGLRIT